MPCPIIKNFWNGPRKERRPKLSSQGKAESFEKNQEDAKAYFLSWIRCLHHRISQTITFSSSSSFSDSDLGLFCLRASFRRGNF